MEILSKIHAGYATFSKAEKRVADYILREPDKAVYLSITELSDACGVGDTSVFRFCKSLGQSGYQEFKLHLAQALASTSQEDAAVQLTGAVGFQDSLEEVMHKVLSANVNALNETFHYLRPEHVTQAVAWLKEAERFAFFGVGGSMVTAMEAHSRFLRITPRAQAVGDLHLQLMSSALLSEGDVAVVFSYSGATKDTLDIARQARAGGAKVIGVTRFARSPLAALCDLVLLCGANEGPLQGGSIAVKMSQLYLLDVLYLEFFRQTLEHSARNKERTSASVTSKLV